MVGYLTKTFLPFLQDYETYLKNKIVKKGITITVSGLSVTGKGTVSDALAKEFKLKKISSGDLFREMAVEKGVSLEKLSEMNTDELDHQIEKRNLELSIQGGYVLDGRLTGVTAGSNADCRILLGCSMDEKAKRAARRDNFSIEESRIRLEKRDTKNAIKHIRLYGTDGMDPSFYDVVIDTTSMGIETTKTEAVKIVKQVLKDKGLL